MNFYSSRINIISFDKFPGLLALYKTDHTDTKMQMTDVLSEETNQTILLYRRDEFIGYNIIDPKNLGYYSDLKTCDEVYVFNAATSTCVLPSLTHCEYPGDISDNCVTCKANEIYIDTDVNIGNLYNNWLVIDGTHNTPISTEIYAVNGTFIKRCSSTNTIDLNDLCTGAYIVKIKLDDKTITRKIIKN